MLVCVYFTGKGLTRAKAMISLFSFFFLLRLSSLFASLVLLVTSYATKTWLLTDWGWLAEVEVNVEMIWVTTKEKDGWLSVGIARLLFLYSPIPSTFSYFISFCCFCLLCLLVCYSCLFFLPFLLLGSHNISKFSSKVTNISNIFICIKSTPLSK